MTKKTKPKHKLFFLRSLQLLNWKLVHVYNCHCDLTCQDTSQTLCLVQRTQFDHRFINKWMLPLKKTLCREKTRLTSQKVRAAVKGLTQFRLTLLFSSSIRLCKQGDRNTTCLLKFMSEKYKDKPYFLSYISVNSVWDRQSVLARPDRLSQRK